MRKNHVQNFESLNFRKVEVSTRNKQRYMQYMRAFKQELMNYKKTRHDNVELFLGACLTYPNLAIVTRNYRGWRLDTHMRDSSPSLDHARMIAEHICQGLGYLHSRRIVHRDLRPANVMFDQAGKVRLFFFYFFFASQKNFRRSLKVSVFQRWPHSLELVA